MSDDPPPMDPATNIDITLNPGKATNKDEQVNPEGRVVMEEGTPQEQAPLSNSNQQQVQTTTVIVTKQPASQQKVQRRRSSDEEEDECCCYACCARFRRCLMNCTQRNHPDAYNNAF